MSQLTSATLYETSHIRIRRVDCHSCRGLHQGPEECDSESHVVMPYRGAFERRVGGSICFADVNQALLFSRGQAYRIDHPGNHGDSCLSLWFSDEWLSELARHEVNAADGTLRFRGLVKRLSPQAQFLAARLRDVSRGSLSAEETAIALASTLWHEQRSGPQRGSNARRRLTDQAKSLLSSTPAHRWSLSELGRTLHVSPVYLTQRFRELEGVSLYQYQTQLRLARALADLTDADDLTALALEHGFTSHSQFAAAFRGFYGMSPSAYRALSRRSR
jgi:AraC family transcriptional regulator